MRRLYTALVVMLLLLAPLGTAALLAAPDDPVEDPPPSTYDPRTDPREAQPLFPEDGGSDLITDQGEPVNALPDLDFTAFLVTVVVWLVVCVALIYGLVALLKLLYRRLPGTGGAQVMEPLASIAVAPGLTMHLVRFNDAVLVLAATGNAVTVVDKVTDPDAVATLIRNTASPKLPPNPRSFAEVLKRTSRQMRREFATSGESPWRGAIAPGEPRVWVVDDELTLELPPTSGPQEPDRERKIRALRQALKELQGTVPAE